jgi:hypothetical protein
MCGLPGTGGVGGFFLGWGGGCFFNPPAAPALMGLLPPGGGAPLVKRGAPPGQGVDRVLLDHQPEESSDT